MAVQLKTYSEHSTFNTGFDYKVIFFSCYIFPLKFHSLRCHYSICFVKVFFFYKGDFEAFVFSFQTYFYILFHDCYKALSYLICDISLSLTKGPFHRTCHQWQLVIHWLLPWQQCFLANQNQECHFICQWMTNCHWWQVLWNGPQYIIFPNIVAICYIDSLIHKFPLE